MGLTGLKTFGRLAGCTVCRSILLLKMATVSLNYIVYDFLVYELIEHDQGQLVDLLSD